MSQRDQTAHSLVEQGALLLDVRTPAEFASGHVSGAVNTPLADLSAAVGGLDPDRVIVVYCRSGMRSRQAAQTLRSKGLTVHDMGGMRSWEGGVDWTFYGLLILACLTLGLAPFTPEPHLVGKLRWVAGGGVGMGLMDVGDLLMHGAPWAVLVFTVARDLMVRLRGSGGES